MARLPKDALIALRAASDRVCGKRLKVMLPTLLPALAQGGRLKLTRRSVILFWPSALQLSIVCSAMKVAASSGKRRRAGSSCALRREVRSHFND